MLFRSAALSTDLAEEIKVFEPFGTGNPAVLFGIFDLTLDKISPVSQGKHLRLTFTKGETSFSAMLFGTTKTEFAYDVGDKVDIAVNIDTNIYNNAVSLTVLVKEIRKSGINEDKLITDIALYEDFKSGKEKDYSSILPTREEVGVIYKQLLKSGLTLDRLTVVNIDKIGYAKTLVSAEALCQLGICAFFEVDGVKTIKVVNSEKKTNLTEAKILKQLGGEYIGT